MNYIIIVIFIIKLTTMKKLYITAIAAVISLSVSAQNFIYPIGQNLVENVTEENYEGYQIDINTPSFEAINYEWELVSNTFLQEWDYSLCDYGGCSIGIPPTGAMTPITLADAQAGVIGWFKIQLTVSTFSGNGKVEIYVYDANDYNRGDVVSWDVTWDAATASLTVNESEQVSFFPNPANENMTVNAEGDFTGVIYNSMGSTVITFNGKTNTMVDVSELNSGIYFVSINSAAGLVKQKLIIK